MPDDVLTPLMLIRARALQLMQLRQWDEALTASEEGLAIEPDDIDLLCTASACCSVLHKFLEALTYAESAVGVNPDSEWAHRLRSTALEAFGRRREAADAALEAIRLAPESADGYIALSSAYRRSVERERHEWAVQPAREATRLAPASSNTWWVLGAAYERLRRWPEAESAYHEALRCDPESVAALTGLARVLSQRHAVREATDMYAAALTLDPMCDEAEDALRRFARRRRSDGVVGMLERRFSAAGVAELLTRRNWWTAGGRTLVLTELSAVVALAALIAWPIFLVGLVTHSNSTAVWWGLLNGDTVVIVVTAAIVDRGRTFRFGRAAWVAAALLFAGAVLATQSFPIDVVVAGAVIAGAGMRVAVRRGRSSPRPGVGALLRGGPTAAIGLGALLAVLAALIALVSSPIGSSPTPVVLPSLAPISFPAVTFGPTH